MYGVLKEAPTSHSTCVEVREQIFGVSSFLVPWGIGMELRSSGLVYMCLLSSVSAQPNSLTLNMKTGQIMALSLSTASFINTFQWKSISDSKYPSFFLCYSLSTYKLKASSSHLSHTLAVTFTAVVVSTNLVRITVFFSTIS